jgi:hypothetical protein
VLQKTKQCYQGEIIMKALLLSLGLLALAACGGDKGASNAAAPEPEPPAPGTVSTDAPQVPAIVEFVWHQKADGFTDEALWSHADYWSNVAGEADWGLMVATVMTPRVANDNFDFLWVMAWPSQEARDNAWSDWGANHEPAWLELTKNTFTYSAEHAYGFAPAPGRPASARNTSGSSVVEFIFCEYKEGKGEADRKAFEAMHAAFMESFEAEVGATSYWWTVMTPLFELPDQNTPDYMWTNFWATDAEREAGYAAYGESAHAAQAMENADCQDPALFDSRVIYLPQA